VRGSGRAPRKDGLLPDLSEVREEPLDDMQIPDRTFAEAEFVKCVEAIRKVASGLEVQAGYQFYQHRTQSGPVLLVTGGDAQVIQLHDKLCRRRRTDRLLLVLARLEGGIHG
jgi:hypothetical protein